MEPKSSCDPQLATGFFVLRERYYQLTTFISLLYCAFLFSWSYYRHTAFQSQAFDLGIFDQAIWLISIGERPYSTLIGRHILGDHFSLILYPLALFYWVCPSVLWLFFVQALSLSIAAPLIYLISRKLNLTQADAFLATLAYLCHPIVTHSNLFDFHPDCLAVPLILAAFLSALMRNYLFFCLSLFLAISCKEILALTVCGLGLVFLTPRFKDFRKFAVIALVFGAVSFLALSIFAIPFFNAGQAASAGIERYGPKGIGIGELFLMYLTDPEFLLSRLHLKESLTYLFKLLLPYFFALGPANLWVLIGAAPAFILNCLSDLDLQRNIRFQYALPILPFLALMVVTALSRGKLLFNNRKVLTIWLVICFTFPLAKAFLKPESQYPHPWRRQGSQHESLKAAVSLIPENASVLAPSYLVPQFSQRKKLAMLKDPNPRWGLEEVDYLILNTKRPGWLVTKAKVEELIVILTGPYYSRKMRVKFSRDGVYLFERVG